MTFEFSVRYSGDTVQSCLMFANPMTKDELLGMAEEALGNLTQPTWASRLVVGVYETRGEQGYSGGLTLMLRGSTDLNADEWWSQAQPYLNQFQRFMNERLGSNTFSAHNCWPVKHWRPVDWQGQRTEEVELFSVL